MERARRQAAWAWALAVAGWCLIVLALVVGLAEPRWYLLDDWRESLIRAAFWAVVVLVPACGVAALVLGRRARRAPGATLGHGTSILAAFLLLVCLLAVLVLLAFLIAAASA